VVQAAAVLITGILVLAVVLLQTKVLQAEILIFLPAEVAAVVPVLLEKLDRPLGVAMVVQVLRLILVVRPQIIQAAVEQVLLLLEILLQRVVLVSEEMVR
jgi:hypothetical protein